MYIPNNQSKLETQMNVEFLRFIDKDTYLKMLILEYLKLRPYYVPANEIAGNFNITYKKSNMMLLDLKNEMDTYFKDNESSIDFIRGKGYFLEVHDDTDLRGFITELIYKNPMIVLLHDIIFKRITSVQKYCQEKFISESKLKKDLSKLKKSVEKLDISIDRNKMTLIGPENKVRFLIFTFYWKVNKDAWPFEYINENEIVSSVNEWSYVQQLNQIEKRKLVYHIAIWKLRIAQKNFIENSDVYEGKVFQKFKQEMEKADLIRTSNIHEFHGLFDVFKVFNFLPNMEECFCEELSNYVPEAVQTSVVLDLFEKKFFQISDMRVYKQTKMFLFSTHTMVKISPNLEIDELGNSYIRYINTLVPKLSERMKFFINDLQNNLQSNIFDKERLLNIRYCMIFYLANKLTVYEKKIYVLFETELNSYIRNYQRDILEYILQKTYNVSVLFEEELPPEVSPDLIVSNLRMYDTNDNLRVTVSRNLTLYEIIHIHIAIRNLH